MPVFTGQQGCSVLSGSRMGAVVSLTDYEEAAALSLAYASGSEGHSRVEVPAPAYDIQAPASIQTDWRHWAR